MTVAIVTSSYIVIYYLVEYLPGIFIMFIYIIYKDPPELSPLYPRSSELPDTSVEKMILVNPVCPVRIMLEYIRKQCRLGIFTQFDLTDQNESLMGLFNLPTYAYATEQFEDKKTYFIVVFKEVDKKIEVLPQLNYENKLHFELKMKVKRFLMVGDLSNTNVTQSKLLTSPSVTKISAHQASRMTIRKK
ncbi:hypothetical protein HW555_003444 [Spodoptera exigua]|uniref:Uncharacterized protein n=1 Tax=Spodoptera exigua TaxID=7107 RepID=A0A835GNU6_SPOEX|nr:hypothetical protein HW555_003444 [Spodoptera exigua]